MGLLRKTISVSSGGTLANYRSKEEKLLLNTKRTAKQAKKQTKLLEEIAKQGK